MTLADRLSIVADESKPLAVRAAAANHVAWQLNRDLIDAVAGLYPDFYWGGGGGGHINADEHERSISFGLTKNMFHADSALTAERRAALVRLGFQYVGRDRIDEGEAP